MSKLRSERFPAFLLLGAAVLGLILANLPFGGHVVEWSHIEVGAGPFALSIAHWVTDLLLAVFFFTAAVELQFEFTSGQLNTLRKAVGPAIAAFGGVVTPILVYLIIAGRGETAGGWPIPTATDIAFALGVLAMFGRGLPKQVRVFLLALAIIDDIVGIGFIAFLYTKDISFGALGLGVVLIVAFGVLSRLVSGRSARYLVPLMVVVALAAWACVFLSGVHATIAGVLLGLAVRQREGQRASHALEPWVNGLVLPLFALFSALVVIPRVPLADLSPAMFAIIVALPVGKLIGICVFGWLSSLLDRDASGKPTIAFADIVPAAALGGIGFTVSLLLARLSFADHPAIADEAVLGVLVGSAISLVASGFVVTARARHHRRLAAA